MKNLKKENINASKKYGYSELYIQAHNNAVDLLTESKILLENKCYARSYFLAFTALEEISKSQHAADILTGYSKKENFKKFFFNHKEKIDRIEWAHCDSSEFPNNYIWLGPDIDDIEKVNPKIPSWEKRQDSLYVNIQKENTITSPKNQITRKDAISIIHIVNVAIYEINLMTEYYGHQIGSKGFNK